MPDRPILTPQQIRAPDDGFTCPTCGRFLPVGEFQQHVYDCAAGLRAERDKAVALAGALEVKIDRDDAADFTALRVAEPPRPVLTAEQKTAAREEMKAQGGPCLHCGGLHSRACPRVRRVKWDGGKPVEAVYWRDGKWPTSEVLFPEDIAEDEEDTP